MQVTEAMVDRLAQLARLHFDAEGRQRIREDLEKMIAFVDQLKGMDLEGVPPLLHPVDGGNVWREDEVRGSIDTADALRNAPAVSGPFFTVPKVIRKEA